MEHLRDKKMGRPRGRPISWFRSGGLLLRVPPLAPSESCYPHHSHAQEEQARGLGNTRKVALRAGEKQGATVCRCFYAPRLAQEAHDVRPNRESTVAADGADAQLRDPGPRGSIERVHPEIGLEHKEAGRARVEHLRARQKSTYRVGRRGADSKIGSEEPGRPRRRAEQAGERWRGRSSRYRETPGARQIIRHQHIYLEVS